MGTSSISGGFSIATFDYKRVYMLSVSLLNMTQNDTK